MPKGSYNEVPMRIFALLFIILVYWGTTISNGFIHDDHREVENNPYLASWEHFPKVFTSCIGGYQLPSCKGAGYYYRPLGVLSLFATRQISSRPWVFHVVSIAYLWVLSMLLFYFLRLHGIEGTVGLIGVAAYVTHPIISEVANGIGVYDLLLAICVVSAILSFALYRKTKRHVWFVCSLLAYFLALLAKESAVVLLVAFPIYDFLYSQKKKRLYQSIGLYSWFLVPLVVYGLMRYWVLGGPVYRQEGYYAMGIAASLVNMIGLYGRNLWALMYPFPLSTFHRFVAISWSSWQFIVSFFALVLTAAAGWASYRRKLPGITFGLSIFVLFLVVPLVFFTKVGRFPFTERFLFVPFIGVTVAVTFLLQSLKPRVSGVVRWLFIVGLAGLFIVNWVGIQKRNADWKNDAAFYASVVRDDPGNEFGYAFGTFKEVLYQKNGLSFRYPDVFTLQEKETGVVLVTKSGFAMSIDSNVKDPLESAMAYLSRQPAEPGALVSEGQAKVAAVEFAWARNWNQKGTEMLELFLFAAGQVVHVTAKPADSVFMGQFDKIVGSFAF